MSKVDLMAWTDSSQHDVQALASDTRLGLRMRAAIGLSAAWLLGATPLLAQVDASSASDRSSSQPSDAVVSPEDLLDQSRAARERGDTAGELRLIEQAAERGSVWGLVELSRRYRWGWEVEADMAKALHYAREAAELGSIYGLATMGTAYLMGDGVPQDRAMALTYFQRLERADLGSALYHYGLYHSLNGDAAQAYENFHKGAELGDPAALITVAQCLEQGSGVTRNSAQAIETYKKLVRSEAKFAPFYAPTSALAIAAIYEAGGSNVPKDRDAAISWYRKAVEFGSDEANEALARLGAN